jgi:hypothetical protein
MSPPSFAPHPFKPYLIEFLGGPSDGVVLRTDSDDESEVTWARLVLSMTDTGAFGKGFRGAPIGTSPFPVRGTSQMHEYRITYRNDDSDDIIVRLAYKGVS